MKRAAKQEEESRAEAPGLAEGSLSLVALIGGQQLEKYGLNQHKGQVDKTHVELYI